MKKKILVGIATGMFAVATVFSFNLSNAKGVGDVSLNDIAVMAQAQEEIDGGMLPEVTVYGYQLERIYKLADGRYVTEEEYEDLQRNKWYTDLYMPSNMAKCAKSICDYFDLTGDPVYGYVSDGRGGEQWSQIDDCDGQPNYC